MKRIVLTLMVFCLACAGSNAQGFLNRLKDHPEFSAEIEKAIKEFERQKKDAMAEYVKPSKSFSYDPATLFRKLKSIAVNQTVYTGYWEAGNGLYSVNKSPRYCGLDEDDRYFHTKITFDEKDSYKWGLIDGEGRQVAPFQYSRVNAQALFPDAFPDMDLMFVYKRDPDGSVHAGALDYSGQARIPFIYDDNRTDVYHREDFVPFEKNGKIGLVSIHTGKEVLSFEYVYFKRIAGGWIVSKDDKHYGLVSVRTGKPVTPLMYSGLLFNLRRPTFERNNRAYDKYHTNREYCHCVCKIINSRSIGGIKIYPYICSIK